VASTSQRNIPPKILMKTSAGTSGLARQQNAEGILTCSADAHHHPHPGNSPASHPRI